MGIIWQYYTVSLSTINGMTALYAWKFDRFGNVQLRTSISNLIGTDYSNDNRISKLCTAPIKLELNIKPT